MPLKFFHPRFWPTWLGITLLQLIVLLPFNWQMKLGEVIGKLLYKLLPSRRKISCINLQIAFPDLSPQEREVLNRQHFISLGQGMFCTAMSWWGSEKRIKRITTIEGLQHLLDAQKEGGVIIVGGHFASLELSARRLASHVQIHSVYRPHQNELMDFIVTQQRDKHYGKTISKNNIRQMITSLKKGGIVWYATDQNYRGKNSILIPFFDTNAPTNPGTTKLSKLTKTKVIPVFPIKCNEKNKGYKLRIYPALTNYPSNDSFQDTLKLSKIIEEQITEDPSQYLWTHKRYKHYNTENKDFYKDFMKKNESDCK